MSLEKLKELRKRRKEGATIALQKSKEYLLACEREAAEKYNELQQYGQWRLQHQEELFSQLQAESFSPDDLGRYMSNIEGMKVKKSQLEEGLEEIKLKYQQAEQSLSERKAALSMITKKLEKLSEIIDIKKKELSSGDGLKEEDVIDEIVAFRAASAR
ncbi:MAG: YscO family type III secretion system apparatus protein [Cocleimonas sp.]|nr:YscO family type III secretion system apparatus protein [Cocleimonas sp.]